MERLHSARPIALEISLRASAHGFESHPLRHSKSVAIWRRICYCYKRRWDSKRTPNAARFGAPTKRQLCGERSCSGACELLPLAAKRTKRSWQRRVRRVREQAPGELAFVSRESRPLRHVGAKSALLRRFFFAFGRKNTIRPLPCSSSPQKALRLFGGPVFAFWGDVCPIGQMMSASPNDVGFANNVCLRHMIGQTSHHCDRKGATSLREWRKMMFALSGK